MSVEMIKTCKDKEAFIVNDHVYHVDNKRVDNKKQTVYYCGCWWRKYCPGRVIVIKNGSSYEVKQRRHHDHVPSIDAVIKKKFINRMKENLRNQNGKSCFQAYLETLESTPVEDHTHSAIPDFSNIKSSMYRVKRKLRHEETTESLNGDAPQLPVNFEPGNNLPIEHDSQSSRSFGNLNTIDNGLNMWTSSSNGYSANGCNNIFTPNLTSNFNTQLMYQPPWNQNTVEVSNNFWHNSWPINQPVNQFGFQ